MGEDQQGGDISASLLRTRNNDADLANEVKSDASFLEPDMEAEEEVSWLSVIAFHARFALHCRT